MRIDNVYVMCTKVETLDGKPNLIGTIDDRQKLQKQI